MMTPAEKAVTCVTVGRLIRSTALIPAASTACCLGLSPAIPTLYHGHGDLAQPLALQPSEPIVIMHLTNWMHSYSFRFLHRQFVKFLDSALTE